MKVLESNNNAIHTPNHDFGLYTIKNDLIYLFRVEGSDYNGQTQKSVQHNSLIGKWYDCSLEYVFDYIKKNKNIPGLQLKIAKVPKNEINKYWVRNHEIAKDCDHEDTNYILEHNHGYDFEQVDISHYNNIPNNIFSDAYKNKKQEFINEFGSKEE